MRILIAKIAISALLLVVSFAPVAASAADAFREGVVYTPLTSAEREDLRQYAEASRVRLQESLEQTHGKSFDEAMDIYRRALGEVVQTSYNDNRRSELLMRMALNQALELTIGFPNAAPGTREATGTLAEIANTNLLTVILEDSIKIALKYLPEDQTALESGSFAGLPYLRFSLERLNYARLWGAAVTEPAWQYRYLKTVLRQWISVATYEAQPRRGLIAKELLHIDALLKKPTPRSEDELKGKVRVLRGDLRRLIESLTSLLKPRDNLLPRLTPQTSAAESTAEVADEAPARPKLSPEENPMPGTTFEGKLGFGYSRAGDSGNGGLGTEMKVELQSKSPPEDRLDLRPSIELKGAYYQSKGFENDTLRATAAVNVFQLPKLGPDVVTQGSIFNWVSGFEHNPIWKGNYYTTGFQVFRLRRDLPIARPEGIRFGYDFATLGILGGKGTYTTAAGQTVKTAENIELFDATGKIAICGSKPKRTCLEDEVRLKAGYIAFADRPTKELDNAMFGVRFSNELSLSMSDDPNGYLPRVGLAYKYELERDADTQSTRYGQHHLLMVRGNL